MSKEIIKAVVSPGSPDERAARIANAKKKKQPKIDSVSGESKKGLRRAQDKKKNRYGVQRDIERLGM